MSRTAIQIVRDELATLNGHPRFYQLLADEAELHARKNADYSGGDPLSNLRECEGMGVRAVDGVLIRMSDKWSRIKVLSKRQRETGDGPQVADESLIDTLLDMAVYAKLAIVLLEEQSSADLLSGKGMHVGECTGLHEINNVTFHCVHSYGHVGLHKDVNELEWSR